MKRTSLIRLGGLAAIVGGVVYAGVALLTGPYFVEYLYYMSEIGYGFIAVLLPLGAMAAIAALHLLHRESYGRAGAAVSLQTISKGIDGADGDTTAGCTQP